MKVSVVVPTYNRGYILTGALQSALRQSYGDFEIIVVDDGSTDNTREIVESCGQGNITYLRHDHNRGCSAAYNTGIEAARGELIAFLDSDDIWKPDYLEHQVGFLTRHPEVDLVFTDTEIRHPLGTVASLKRCMKAFPKLLAKHAKSDEYVVGSREMYLCLLQEVPIKPTACVIKRSMFDRAGGFNETWPSGTDWDLFLRFSRSACFGYIDRPLVIQFRTTDATHLLFREEDKTFLLGVLGQEKEKLRQNREGLRAVNRGLFIHYNSLGWVYVEREEWRKAGSTYWQGFKETGNPMLLRKLMAGWLRSARSRMLGRRRAQAETPSQSANLVAAKELAARNPQ